MAHHRDLTGTPAISRHDRRSSEGLRDSALVYRSTFELAPVAMACIGLDGAWLAANAAFRALLGYTRDDLLSRRLRDVLHRGDVSAEADVAALFSSGNLEHDTRELRFVRSDGSVLAARMRSTLVRDERNVPLYVLAVVDEIPTRDAAPSDDTRRFAGDVLAARLARMKPRRGIAYGIAVLASALSVLLTSAISSGLEAYPTTIVTVAVATAAFYGGAGPGLLATLLTVAGLDWFVVAPVHSWQIATPTDQVRLGLFVLMALVVAGLSEWLRDARTRAETAVVQLDLQNTTLREQALELEFQQQQLQDQAAELESSNEQLRDKGLASDAARTRTERLQKLTAALTSRTSVPQILALLAQEATSALGAVAGAVALMDDSGSALRFASWFGYPDGVMNEWMRVPLSEDYPLTEAVNAQRSVWVASPAELAARWPNFVEASQAVPSAAWAVVPLTAADRRIGAFAMSFAEPREAGDDLGFAESIARLCAQALVRARLQDNEREARAEAERARSAAELASQAKSQFLANMSHELRTPLNAIAGHVQLLEMGLHGPVTPQQRGALERVELAQRHLLGLINDLLNFAKLETGKVEYDIRVTDLGAVLADAAPMIEPQIAVKGLVYDVRPPARECRVWADPDKLRQVLLNLLSNATKFTPSGGRVTVDVATSVDTPNVVFLRVSDTGIGIARDQQESVFEPFVQVRNSFARSTEGTGLGLAISRELARGMGGELRVRSAEGQGATFTVMLRAVTAEEERSGRVV